MLLFRIVLPKEDVAVRDLLVPFASVRMWKRVFVRLTFQLYAGELVFSAVVVFVGGILDVVGYIRSLFLKISYSFEWNFSIEVQSLVDSPELRSPFCSHRMLGEESFLLRAEPRGVHMEEDAHELAFGELVGLQLLKMIEQRVCNLKTVKAGFLEHAFFNLSGFVSVDTLQTTLHLEALLLHILIVVGKLSLKREVKSLEVAYRIERRYSFGFTVYVVDDVFEFFWS